MTDTERAVYNFCESPRTIHEIVAHCGFTRKRAQEVLRRLRRRNLLDMEKVSPPGKLLSYAYMQSKTAPAESELRTYQPRGMCIFGV